MSQLQTKTYLNLKHADEKKKKTKARKSEDGQCYFK